MITRIAVCPSRATNIYDQACRELGWDVRAWENVHLDDLMPQLARFDIVICQQNYNLRNAHDFRERRKQWLSYLEHGGIVLAMEVQACPEQLDWIVDIGPDFNLTVRSFRDFQHGSPWKNSRSEIDLGYVKPTWGHFSDWAPSWVVTNRNAHEKPIILYRQVGQGLLLASTTYFPFFPRTNHLETIWYRWKMEGAKPR